MVQFSSNKQSNCFFHVLNSYANLHTQKLIRKWRYIPCDVSSSSSSSLSFSMIWSTFSKECRCSTDADDLFRMWSVPLLSVSSSPMLLLSTGVSPPPLSSMQAVVFVESRSETTVRCTYGKLFVSNITYGVLHDVVHDEVLKWQTFQKYSIYWFLLSISIVSRSKISNFRGFVKKTYIYIWISIGH